VLHLTALVNRPYELATITRFYYSAGCRRISKAHVWLISADGQRRVQVSRSQARRGPVWADRNHVAWTERHEAHDELWVASLPSLHRKKLATRSNIELRGRFFEFDGGSFAVSGRKLIRARVAENFSNPGELIRDKSGWGVAMRNGPYRIVNEDEKWKVSTAVEGFVSFSLASWGQVGGQQADETIVAPGGPILRFEYALTAIDSLALLVKLDQKTQTARVVPIDAEAIELDGVKRQLLGVPNRRIETFGEIRLFASSVFFGDLPSLRYRRLKLPFSYTLSAALRPKG
jgi:hypothetical protein